MSIPSLSRSMRRAAGSKPPARGVYPEKERSGPRVRRSASRIAIRSPTTWQGWPCSSSAGRGARPRYASSTYSAHTVGGSVTWPSASMTGRRASVMREP